MKVYPAAFSILTVLVLVPIGALASPQTPSDSIASGVEWALGGRSLAYTPFLAVEGDLRGFSIAGEAHISKGTLEHENLFSGARSYVMTVLGVSGRKYIERPPWLPIDPYWGARLFYLRVWLGPESSPFPILASCEHLPSYMCGNSGSLETVGFGPLVGADIPLLRWLGLPIQTQLNLAMTILPNPISPPFEPMGVRVGIGVLYEF